MAKDKTPPGIPKSTSDQKYEGSKAQKDTRDWAAKTWGPDGLKK